jgi:hypothetical protein
MSVPTQSQRSPNANHPAASIALVTHGGRRTLRLAQVREFTAAMLGDDVHAKRVLSLGNGVAGVLRAATLSVHAIGQGYAAMAKTNPKHGVKQLDRLLSNVGLDLDLLFPAWVRFVVGSRPEIVVALDWTEFDKDDHSTLAAYLVTRHGRATPLIWSSHTKSDLKGNQKRWEQELLGRLHKCLEPSIGVTLLADRGFGDQKLYEFLTLHGWDYVIRFRGDILVTNAADESKPAAEWVSPSGRATVIRDARVTADLAKVPAVVLQHARGMKEAWCLATSLATATAKQVVTWYSKRFSIEETFRDTKDIHFGQGLKSTHIGRTDRRDRLLFLFAMAHALLTLLGAASERVGFDRMLKVNTVKKRTHSLFRQGTYWYHALPDMREDWLGQLMAAFDEVVREHAVMQNALGFL